MNKLKTEETKHQQRAAGWKTATLTWIVIMLLLSALLYARRFDYNLFIFNKAVAGSAVFLIGLSFLIGPLAGFWPNKWVQWIYLRKYFGIFGFAVAALHMILSLIMFSPAYYPKLFTAAGKLTSGGEFSMAFAAIAFIIFSAVSITSIPAVEEKLRRDQWQVVQRVGYVAFFLTALHIVIIKWHGWFDPTNWLHGLPPASLFPFLFIVLVFIFRIAVMFLPRKAEQAKS